MKSLWLHASDGVRLSVTVFEAHQPNGKLLLINSATGVKQQVYFSFAKFMAEEGVTVITYDYRGIGLSKPEEMKGFKASMRIWGTEDLKTITTFIDENFRSYQKFCLGHSVGALILGMTESTAIFDKFIFIATQDAYVGNLKTRVAITALLGFGVAVPLTNCLLAFFPAQWFGLGESLPKGVANDWRTLILHPKSTSRLYEKIKYNYARALSQPTVVMYAQDDPWVTEKGMESLLSSVYPHLQKTYRELKTIESEKGEIGHVNFFRSFNRKMWHIVLDEL